MEVLSKISIDLNSFYHWTLGWIAKKSCELFWSAVNCDLTLRRFADLQKSRQQLPVDFRRESDIIKAVGGWVHITRPGCKVNKLRELAVLCCPKSQDGYFLWLWSFISISLTTSVTAARINMHISYELISLTPFVWRPDCGRGARPPTASLILQDFPIKRKLFHPFLEIFWKFSPSSRFIMDIFYWQMDVFMVCFMYLSWVGNLSSCLER